MWVGAIVGGLAFGAWFVVRQLRDSAPLLDVRLFANRTVSGALIGSIGVATYRATVADTLPAAAEAAARDSLDGAVDAAADLPGDLGAALLDAAREAFTSGPNVGALVAAGVAAVAAGIAAVRLWHVPPTGTAAKADKGADQGAGEKV